MALDPSARAEWVYFGATQGETIAFADQTCDGAVNVVDPQLLIGAVLGAPLSPALDADGDRCHDACATAPTF